MALDLPHNAGAGEDIVQGPTVVPDQYEQVSPLEHDRAHAVGCETEGGPGRADGTSLSVIHDPKTHRPFPRGGSEQTPSDYEIAPPQGNPKPQDAARVAKPSGVGSRAGEIVDTAPQCAPVEGPFDGDGEQETEAAVDGHIQNGRDQPAECSCRSPAFVGVQRPGHVASTSWNTPAPTTDGYSESG